MKVPAAALVTAAGELSHVKTFLKRFAYWPITQKRRVKIETLVMTSFSKTVALLKKMTYHEMQRN